MTNAELIAKINAEIERLKVDYLNRSYTFVPTAMQQLLDFIDTLESEKPVPNDLEEAADEYEKKHTYQRYDGGGLTPEYNATLAEAFIAGYNLCKEQMMKEAVEGVVCYGSKGAYIETDFLGEYDTDVYGNPGDKVRIIIVKE